MRLGTFFISLMVLFNFSVVQATPLLTPALLQDRTQKVNLVEMTTKDYFLFIKFERIASHHNFRLLDFRFEYRPSFTTRNLITLNRLVFGRRAFKLDLSDVEIIQSQNSPQVPFESYLFSIQVKNRSFPAIFDVVDHHTFTDAYIVDINQQKSIARGWETARSLMYSSKITSSTSSVTAGFYFSKNRIIEAELIQKGTELTLEKSVGYYKVGELMNSIFNNSHLTNIQIDNNQLHFDIPKQKDLTSHISIKPSQDLGLDAYWDGEKAQKVVLYEQGILKMIPEIFRTHTIGKNDLQNPDELEAATFIKLLSTQYLILFQKTLDVTNIEKDVFQRLETSAFQIFKTQGIHKTHPAWLSFRQVLWKFSFLNEPVQQLVVSTLRKQNSNAIKCRHLIM